MGRDFSRLTLLEKGPGQVQDCLCPCFHCVYFFAFLCFHCPCWYVHCVYFSVSFVYFHSLLSYFLCIHFFFCLLYFVVLARRLVYETMSTVEDLHTFIQIRIVPEGEGSFPGEVEKNAFFLCLIHTKSSPSSAFVSLPAPPSPQICPRPRPHEG